MSEGRERLSDDRTQISDQCVVPRPRDPRTKVRRGRLHQVILGVGCDDNPSSTFGSMGASELSPLHSGADVKRGLEADCAAARARADQLSRSAGEFRAIVDTLRDHQ